MATTTNYSWTTPDDTGLVKDGASAIRTLGTAIDTTTKNLNPETTLGDIVYRSSTANVKTRLGIGTSGQVLTVAAGVPSWANGFSSPLTTTGDTIYSSSGSTPARLGIGSTGQILTVSGGIPSWATPAAGGGMTLISQTVASANDSISFTDISGDYKQLLLIWFGVSHSNTSSKFAIRLNNNSSAVYATNGLSGINSTFSTGANADNFIGNGDNASFGKGANSASQANAVSGMLLVDNYASSSKYKGLNIQHAFYENDVDKMYYFSKSGQFESTTAVTSVNIVRLAGAGTISNATNTTIRLYGVS